MKTTQDLRITLENCNQYTNLVECGDIIIEEGVVCTFPALQTSGYIDLRVNAKGTFPALQTSGYIYLSENAKGTFPALQTSGYIYLRVNAKVTFPALQTSGNIDLRVNAKVTFPALQTSGNIDLSENAKGTFPALQTSGNIDLSENAKGTFPALQTSGNIYLSENAKGTFPALQTSGNIYLSENAKIETKITKGLNYKSVDNNMFVIESEKSTKGIKILTGYNLLNFKDKKIVKEECFVAEKDNYTAHGKTIKQAMSDLQFKIIAEKLKHDPITKNTIITAEYYHIVTGSCKLGIESWINQHGLKVTEIKASELLPILEKSNAYGLERFKKLIQF